MLLHFLLSRAAYAIMEELRICNRDHVSHKAERVDHLCFYRRSLLFPALNHQRAPNRQEQTSSCTQGWLSLIKLASSLGPLNLGEKDTIDFSSKNHKTKQETVQRLGHELKSD